MPCAAPQGVGRLQNEAVTSEGDHREGVGPPLLPSRHLPSAGAAGPASSGTAGWLTLPQSSRLVFPLEPQGHAPSCPPQCWLLLPSWGQAQGLVCGSYGLSQGQAHSSEPQPPQGTQVGAGQAGGRRIHQGSRCGCPRALWEGTSVLAVDLLTDGQPAVRAAQRPSLLRLRLRPLSPGDQTRPAPTAHL